ncbi:MAG: alanine racemase [Trueperaceae bacterium]|jgi:D-serine deaminase-like pyridoxal phosphate-dependent protein|nr:alanine racemase [Truepera sp.]HRN18446.1 alanine racemase [Trueperaceae bacterium]HRQ10702.1 alanine racemase [Trueperaceae bacterium]
MSAPAVATSITSIDTPCVVVDLDVAERNIRRLQDYLDEHGIQNRPHIKTHKLPLLAHWQVAAGACGITVQSIGEAEVMAGAGLTDILITYNVMGEEKVRRLAQVARMARVRVAVDNEVALEAVAAAALLAERPIGVLVEFESGKLRQGVVTPEEAAELAQVAAGRPYVEFLGLLTYPSSERVPGFVTRTRELLAEVGIDVKVVSVGGTPGMWRTHLTGLVTEHRAGTYIYNDRNSMAAGSASLEDCALHVHVTLVSKPTPNRGVIDAGSKTLAADPFPQDRGGGYGLILEYPEAIVTVLSEEHGAVDFSACSRTPAIGERLRVIPNHVCPVSNLHDEVYTHRRGVLEAVLPVAARGKTR